MTAEDVWLMAPLLVAGVALILAGIWPERFATAAVWPLVIAGVLSPIYWLYLAIPVAMLIGLEAKNGENGGRPLSRRLFVAFGVLFGIAWASQSGISWYGHNAVSWLVHLVMPILLSAGLLAVSRRRIQGKAMALTWAVGELVIAWAFYYDSRHVPFRDWGPPLALFPLPVLVTAIGGIGEGLIWLVARRRG